VTSSAVFVDATGRRARAVRLGCWVLGSAFGGYVLLVVIALVVPAGTLSLSVPGLGPVLPKTEAPPLTTVPGGTGVPVSVLARLATPKPHPSRAGRPALPSATLPASATARATGRPSVLPTKQPTALPTAVRGTGKPSAHPTPRPHASKTPPPHP
jgi:hypothetical protein